MKRCVIALAFGTLAACDGDGIAGPGTNGYTDAELTYFAEVAFGAEYGSSGADVLHRWGATVSIRAHGTPTAADAATLADVLGDINALTQATRLQTTQGLGEIDLYFVPQADFPLYEPNYVPGNIGFVWVTWNSTQQFTFGRIMVSTNIAQADRAHVIREELTQGLGLLRDSDRYPTSIFYSSPSRVTEYAPIDRAIIEMLYRPELAPGMSAQTALSVLRTLRRR